MHCTQYVCWIPTRPLFNPNQPCKSGIIIGHAKEYPTMHYFGIPRCPLSMIVYKILTEWNYKIGTLVNIPNYCFDCFIGLLRVPDFGGAVGFRPISSYDICPSLISSVTSSFVASCVDSCCGKNNKCLQSMMTTTRTSCTRTTKTILSSAILGKWRCGYFSGPLAYIDKNTTTYNQEALPQINTL